jgi:hypothetical protein
MPQCLTSLERDRLTDALQLFLIFLGQLKDESVGRERH